MTDPYNPYAAPQASPAFTSVDAPGSPQPWEVGEVLRGGWQRLRAYGGVLVVGYLIEFLATQAVSQTAGIGAGLMMRTNSVGGWIAQGSGAIGAWVVGTFFHVGFIRMALEAARGQEPKLGTLFLGGDRMLPLLGVGLLTGLAAGLGLVLFIVPGVILGLGLSLAPFYVVDAKMSPSRAISASWSMTKGHRAQLLVLAFAAFFIVLAGVLACCIGILGAVPLCYVAFSIVFVRISGRGVAAEWSPANQQGGSPY